MEGAQAGLFVEVLLVGQGLNRARPRVAVPVWAPPRKVGACSDPTQTQGHARTESHTHACTKKRVHVNTPPHAPDTCHSSYRNKGCIIFAVVLCFH